MATLAERAKIGIALPQTFPDGNVRMDLIRSFAERAEELGYADLWAMEQLVGHAPALEPLHLLTHVAAIARKPRLGVAVLVPARHNPVVLAKRLATLDQLSEGRLVVGVGGGGPHDDRPALGLPGDRRGARLTETVAILKALWTETEASHPGELWQLEGVAMEPKPLQRPHPPIWFGARSPSALRRAVRLGDGWMGAGSSSVADFREQIAAVREALEEVSSRDDFAISKRVYLHLDPDVARAERRLREWFDLFYGNAEMADRVTVRGTETECVERLEELVDAGAEHLVLNPVFEHAEHLERLAELTGLAQ